MVILPFFVWGIKMVHLTNISKQHGSQILFKKASLQILTGARIGLVGANGTGKTTIFHLITGEEDADEGEISFSKKKQKSVISPRMWARCPADPPCPK